MIGYNLVLRVFDLFKIVVLKYVFNVLYCLVVDIDIFFLKKFSMGYESGFWFCMYLCLFFVMFGYLNV